MERKEEATCNNCGFEEGEKSRREVLSMKTMNEEEKREAVEEISSDKRMTKLLTLLFDRITRDEMRFLAGRPVFLNKKSLMYRWIFRSCHMP